MSGKGDVYRPVDRERFDRNYDAIEWQRARCIQCGELPFLGESEFCSERCARDNADWKAQRELAR